MAGESAWPYIKYDPKEERFKHKYTWRGFGREVSRTLMRSPDLWPLFAIVSLTTTGATAFSAYHGIRFLRLKKMRHLEQD